MSRKRLIVTNEAVFGVSAVDPRFRPAGVVCTSNESYDSAYVHIIPGMLYFGVFLLTTAYNSQVQCVCPNVCFTAPTTRFQTARRAPSFVDQDCPTNEPPSSSLALRSYTYDTRTI